ncbi:MAG: phenylacetate--CoA ligase [Enterococcus sp.]|nr:phenylacetate--CoA ligase [Enterococcus sp.]
MFFQEEIECMDRNALKRLQFERLQDSLKNSYNNVDFYKILYDKADVKPKDVKSLDDLHKLPFVEKQDLRDNYPYGMFAVPLKDAIRIHSSSGTSGQATLVGNTAYDLDVWAQCFARGISMVGGSSDSVMQVAYGYGLFTGGLGAHCGGEKMGCTVIPISAGNTKRQIQMIKDLHVNILCCTPSYALYIADTAYEMGYNPKEDFELIGGIFGAEPASEALKKQIAEKLDIQYCDVYGLSEIMGPGVAMECSEMSGLHFAEDHFYPEIIDPKTGEVLEDGEIGELVITTLTRQCCPLIRYRTHDLTRIISELCPCGRTHRRIDHIMGRSDDMLIIRGVNVFPMQIEQVLASFDEISPYYQIIIDRKGQLDTVQLNVEAVPEFHFDQIRAIQQLSRRLAGALKDNTQVAIDVKVVEPQSIERSIGKANRVKDLRKLKG